MAAVAALTSRLQRLQVDHRALEAEVGATIRAQRDQIGVLNRQAAQLSQEAAAEQRLAGAAAANSKQAKMGRMQQEHAQLVDAIESEARRATHLSNKLKAAKEEHAALLQPAGQPAKRRPHALKESPALVQLQRVQASVDDTKRASVALREEIDHLRKEQITFGERLRHVEAETEELRGRSARARLEIKQASEARDQCERRVFRLEGMGAVHSRWRSAQRTKVSLPAPPPRPCPAPPRWQREGHWGAGPSRARASLAAAGRGAADGGRARGEARAL